LKESNVEGEKYILSIDPGTSAPAGTYQLISYEICSIKNTTFDVRWAYKETYTLTIIDPP
jgi:hypothetical protein